MAQRKRGAAVPAPGESARAPRPVPTAETPTWPWARLTRILAGCLAALAVLHAWVAEDAFITFRVVDNFVHGFGLRWNVDERVQVFTHPLWLLIHLPVRFLTGNLYLATMFIGIGATLAAVRLVAVRSGATAAGVTLFLAALVVSKSFVEFATSGLETSLAFLLLAALVVVFLEEPGKRSDTRPFWIGVLCALIGVNRLDHLLLVLPAVLLLLREAPDGAWRRRLLLGFSPLVAWELFALYYYGFPLPNTAYAKLGGGISRLVYLRQGALYLVDFLRRDLAAAGVMLGVALLPFVLQMRRAARATAATRMRDALALGVGLYVLYVISVGGDFMTGRLWSVPFFTAACIALFSLPAGVSETGLRRALLLLVALRLVSFGLEPPQRVDGIHRERVWAGIKDERLSYALGHTLYNVDRTPRFRWSMTSKESYPPMAVYWWAVGLPPYMSGPQVVVVDGLALGDPLLSRMPALRGQRFLIGHIKRHVPLGYLESRAAGSLKPLPESLRPYVARLQLITAAPLDAPDRLATIVKFNLGQYDGLLKGYLAGNPVADTMDSGVSVPAPRLAPYLRR